MRFRVMFIMLIVSGCASQVRVLDNVHEGMDKDEVLEAAGNPKRTFRSNSEDHWIYIFFKDDKEWDRQIDFKAGKVIRIGRPVPKRSWTRQLEDTNTMEEFERKAREHQRKSGDFKDIDGG
jgi:hypothetical protein